MQLLLTSLPRRARAAGLLLRLPASQPEQATAARRQRATWVARRPRAEVGPEATPVARMVGSRALCELYLPAVEGGSTALNALSRRPCRPRGRQGRLEVK